MPAGLHRFNGQPVAQEKVTNGQCDHVLAEVDEQQLNQKVLIKRIAV